MFVNLRVAKVKLTTNALLRQAGIRLSFLTLSYLLILASPRLSVAHEGEAHPSKTEHRAQSGNDASNEALKAINESYTKNVKSIFKKSCFDCHSNQTKYPWYAKLPGAKQLIASDISEANSHLDMSEDFPFKGHGSPIEDLEAIRKAVVENSMPPFRYWILHNGSRLSSEEKKAVLEWVNSSLQLLKDPQPQERPK